MERQNETLRTSTVRPTTEGIPVPCLRRNATWTVQGNIVYAGCRWLVLVFLAKLGSPEMVGQFVLGLAVVEPVFMGANLQLRAVVATDATGDFPFHQYLGLRFVTSFLALALVAAIVWVTNWSLATSLVIMAVALAKAVDSFSDIFYGLLQHHEQMASIAKSMMMKGVFALPCFTAGLYGTDSVVGGVVGLAVALGIVTLGYDARNGAAILRAARRPGARHVSMVGILRGTLGSRTGWHAMKAVAWLALPLGVVMLLISVNLNMPRYFIEHVLGEWELGIFGAMVYLVVAGSTVVDALGQSATPRLAKYYATGDRAAYHALLMKLLGAGFAMGAAGVGIAMLAGREILTVIYGADYAAHNDVFIWLMIGGTALYVASFLGFGVTATRRFRQFLIPYVLVTAVTLAGSAALIAAFGLIGAAWAACLTSIVTCAVLAILVATVDWTGRVKAVRRQGWTVEVKPGQEPA